MATLLDVDAEARFRDDGFTVVDWLDPDRLAALVAAVDEIHPAPPADSPWACDFYSEDPATKARVQDVIGDAFRASVEEVFVDHHTYLHAFVVNWPGTGGGLPLHQHSSVVEEPEHRSAVVWCALRDTTPTTGTLYVVPGSHRVQGGPKAERSPDWFEGHEDAIRDRHSTPVYLRAGQALVFDNALLHFSDENRSDGPRLTAVANLAPRSAELRYYSWTDRGELEVYRLDPTFFLGAVSSDFEWAEPEGLELVGTRPARHAVPRDDELAGLLRPAERPRRSRWRRRAVAR
jgi:hypothetical protein